MTAVLYYAMPDISDRLVKKQLSHVIFIAGFHLIKTEAKQGQLLQASVSSPQAGIRLDRHLHH